MKRTLTLGFVALPILLAACSKEPQDSPTRSATVASESASLPQTDVAEEAQSGSSQSSEAAVVGVSQIPEAIRGRWGLVVADCRSGRGDAKGLLEVTANQLKFYESVADLGEIKEEGEGRIRAVFDFTGEGQSWTQDVVLDVKDDGKTLTRRDYGKDVLPGTLTYTRCK